MEAKAESGKPGQIDIKVKDQNENEVFFKIKRTTKLSKVFDAYCQRQSIERANVRFLLDGTRIQDEDTPEGLEMEDGDMIEVVLEQTGGDTSPDPRSCVTFKINHGPTGDVYFKSKRLTKMSKAFQIYCERQSISRDTVSFLLNGAIVKDDDTPSTLRILNGDSFHVVNRPIPPEGPPHLSKGYLDSSITVSVEDQAGDQRYFKIKRNTRLEKIFEAHKNLKAYGSHNARFLFEGLRVSKRDTADSIGLGDGDILEFYPEQRGGSNEGSNQGPNANVESGIPDRINILVSDTQHNQLHFKIKMTTSLLKVMNAWAEKHQSIRDNLQFTFQGAVVRDNDTPEILGMKEDDVLNVAPKEKNGDAKDPSNENQQAENGEYLGVRVADQSGNEQFFRIKKTTVLGKVMRTWCDREGKDLTTCRFMFEMSRIQETDTANSLELEEGDMIEVFVEQTGGSAEAEDEAAGDEKIKPERQPLILQIKVKNDHQHEVEFKLRSTAKLGKLMKAYAEQQGRSVDSLRFFTSDGKRILKTHTPEDLEMVSGYVIDVQEEMQGGGLS